MKSSIARVAPIRLSACTTTLGATFEQLASEQERAWGTILDSNVTTLIAGLALLIFGSGAIRGFAVVHCLGILTSMFSAVFFSRGLANFWYGSKKKLTGLAIGQIWKPSTGTTGTAGAGAGATQDDGRPQPRSRGAGR